MRDGMSTKQLVHLGNVTLSGTTAAASDWVDLQGFTSCTLILVPNTVTDAGTASGFTATLQESGGTATGTDSANSTAAASASAVAAVDAVNGAVTVTVTSDSADDSIAGALGYLGIARYARVNIVGTTGTDADVSVMAVLERAHYDAPTLIGTAVSAT